jgi:hypothetical protein
MFKKNRTDWCFVLLLICRPLHDLIWNQLRGEDLVLLAHLVRLEKVLSAFLVMLMLHRLESGGWRELEEFFDRSILARLRRASTMVAERKQEWVSTF